MIKKVASLLLITLLLAIVLLTSGCSGSSVASDGDIVRVHYTGTLEDGSVFDSSVGGAPLGVPLGSGQLIFGFEKAVYGLKIGEIKTVTIPPEEAYGPHRDDLLIVLEREQLPEDLNPEVDEHLELTDADGRRTEVIVTDITETTITIDTNHPLAGKSLTFEIELVGIN